MYIVKNAFRCIARSKGRNILIGMIALVIAVSACIGLSIRQGVNNAKTKALEGMSITASISYDRANAMGQMGGGRPGGSGGGGSFDRNQFADWMGSFSSLTLEEYLAYAEASSVQDFYYTLTAYFNGSEGLSPVSDEVEESEESESDGQSEGEAESQTPSGLPGGMGGMMGGMMGGFSSGDLTVVGYSSDSAMTAFVNGTASIVDGSMFEQASEEAFCVISEELAMFNDLSKGDTIVITNPSLESESYTLTVCGIYTSDENNDYSMSMFGKSQDPANRIYMSATALQSILTSSKEASTTVTDDYGREKESEISSTLAATYAFADPEAYYLFEQEVRDLGLGEEYKVSSSDVDSYEKRLEPLETLGMAAGWFLVVILTIGGVILVVLNIFNVRERKYEVGVLTAMGMKKSKVALQFICEVLVVTMIAVLLGSGVGAVCSLPVTNALLAGQEESQNQQQAQLEENFGRPGNFGGFPGGDMPGGMPSELPEKIEGAGNPFGDMFAGVFDGAVDYITEVDSAMDLSVVVKMLGVGLLLTLLAGAASVLFIMRYDPLKILANRD